MPPESTTKLGASGLVQRFLLGTCSWCLLFIVHPQTIAAVACNTVYQKHTEGKIQEAGQRTNWMLLKVYGIHSPCVWPIKTILKKNVIKSFSKCMQISMVGHKLECDLDKEIQNLKPHTVFSKGKIHHLVLFAWCSAPFLPSLCAERTWMVMVLHMSAMELHDLLLKVLLVRQQLSELQILPVCNIIIVSDLS